MKKKKPAIAETNTRFYHFSYLNLTKNSPATNADFTKLTLNRDGQVLNITLKQLILIWKPVNASQGEYLEAYKYYSGYEPNFILTSEKLTSVSEIPYGKYEIEVSDAANFKLRDITELNPKNVTFLLENGKYYVTYSYKFKEEWEDLNVNLLLNSSMGYTLEQKVSHYFKPNTFILLALYISFLLWLYDQNENSIDYICKTIYNMHMPIGKFYTSGGILF